MSKRIEQMNLGEISMLLPKQKEDLFQQSIVLAIRMCICDRNTTPANLLLKLVPSITKKAGAKEALIEYFETWGNFCFERSSGKLLYDKSSRVHKWTNEYEAEVKASSWLHLIVGKPQPTNNVYDVEKEFRKLHSRLQKLSNEPTSTIIHAPLLSKIEGVLNAYGRTDEWAFEDKKGRTLFDKSVQNTTNRASKYAKGA